jgi:hypothetical protein
MGRPGAARRLAGSATGGAAIRPNSAQLIVLAAALASAVGVAARAAFLAGDLAAAAAGTGALGCALLLAGGLAGRPAATAWGIALLAGAYAGALAVGPADLDPWAPALAAGIALAAEAGVWAAELRTAIRLDPAVVRTRAGLLLATAAGAAGVGLILIAPGAGPELSGSLVTGAGVAAAVTAVAVIRAVAHRA